MEEKERTVVKCSLCRMRRTEEEMDGYWDVPVCKKCARDMSRYGTD